MMLASTCKRHRYLLQALLVAVTASACVLLTDAFSFRSPLNLAWMIGAPMAVALVANDGLDRRCFMAMALPGVSLIVVILVAVAFTSYG